MSVHKKHSAAICVRKGCSSCYRLYSMCVPIGKNKANKPYLARDLGIEAALSTYLPTNLPAGPPTKERLSQSCRVIRGKNIGSNTYFPFQRSLNCNQGK